MTRPLEFLAKPHGAWYDQLPQPQFLIEPLGPPDEAVLNGGIGDGGPGTYFCSTRDELTAYRALKGGTSSGYNPNDSHWGTYQFLRLIDRCRTDGCGEIGPHGRYIKRDGKYLVLGIPTHATNCHPWGYKLVFNEPDPDSLDNPDWQGRNGIQSGPNDPYSPLFGRYLLKIIDKDLGDPSSHPRAEVHLGPDMQLTVDDGPLMDQYKGTATSPNFFDVPYDAQHLSWGFTCSQIARAGGYKANPDLDKISEWMIDAEWPMEGEREGHYKSLLTYAKDRLAEKIADGSYGEVYPSYFSFFGLAEGLTVEQSEMSEIVNNAWAILDRLVKPSCGFWHPLSCIEEGTDRATGWTPPEMMCCQVANGTLVEYQADKNRICLRPDVCMDCMSKRLIGSDAHNNVSGSNGAGHCTPYYGEFVDDPYGGGDGLYDKNRVSNEFFIETHGSGNNKTYEMKNRHIYPPLDGYSPVIVSMIAHQLVHAYFQKDLKTNRMASWPSPESLWEEELAVMTQALVLNHLCKLGYCPDSFEMKKEEYYTHTGEKKTRYFYPNSPIGFAEIFIGPYYANMFNIARQLGREKEPEMARMLAYFHAMGPLLDHPKAFTLNGEENSWLEYGSLANILAQGGPTASSLNVTVLGQQAQPSVPGTYQYLSSDPSSCVVSEENESWTFTQGSEGHAYQITNQGGTVRWLDGSYPNFVTPNGSVFVFGDSGSLLVHYYNDSNPSCHYLYQKTSGGSP